MTFANADAFLLLLVLIPLAVAKLIGDGMARRRVLRIAGARLLPQLRRGGWRGRELLVFFFEVLAVAFFIAALARPQWGHTERQVQGEGRSIIVAIDTSRSMLADDLKPDRLTRAKLAAVDLVASLPGDRIGLIAFAGRAFLQAPLTTDHEALIEALQQFDAELIPRGGSNPSEAIDLAVEIFDKAGTASHALVMFSDGDELEGNAVEAARKAKDRGAMIVSVGVGTREGALVPDAHPQRQGGFQRDASGRPVRSKLEEQVLESLARETNGMYLNLSRGSELRERVQVILNKLDRSRTAAQRDSRQPIERYPWALIPGVVSLVVAFALRLGRRMRAPAPVWTGAGAGSAAVLLLVCGPTVAQAGVIVPGDPPGPSPYQLYDRANFAEAADGFERELSATRSRSRGAALEFGLGSAAFRQADHDGAIEAFGRALTSPDRGLQAEAAYNLGNALAHKAKTLPKAKGRVSAMIDLITEAIAHYDEALKIQPGHANARENRELLAKYLEELKAYRQQLREKARQRRKNQQGKSQQEQDGQQGQDQEGQQGENQPGGQGKGNQGGESGEEEEEEEGEEGGEETGESGANGEQGAEGRGREGQNDGQGGGKQDDRQSPAPEGQEKERSGEEKSEGDVEAKGGGTGGDGDQEKRLESERAGTSADARRNKSTGFSRSEARALLRALSDEDYVRPLTERAAPEGSYKNW